MKLSTLRRALLLTLGYTHHFSFPLTASELFGRLIIRNSQGTISTRFFCEALVSLVKEGLVHKSGSYFSFTTPLVQQAGALRTRRKSESHSKMEELKPLIAFMRLLPWIVAVGVTGSVAVESAEESDDTDICIVVEPGSLWLVRPVLVLFSLLYKKRRSWYSEEPRSWCLNLWLETTNLALPSSRWSVYSAYEVCQIKWIIDKNMIGKTFLERNKWVKYYLPHYYALCCNAQTTQSRSVLITFLLYFLKIWTVPANCFAFVVQWWYMLPHMTREKVSYHTAFFHPRNTGYLVTQRWRDSLHMYISS